VHEDNRAQSIIAFLRAEGAGRMHHAGARTLLDHLVGTYELARRWQQPEWLQHAALVHSIYGTDAFHEQLIAPSRRAEVAAVAGERAERLGYLFGVTPRERLFAGTHRWTASETDATRDELDELVLLHMANLAEQARAEDGAPGLWLVRIRELAELLLDSEAVTLPLFIAELASFTEADELTTAQAYRDGIAGADADRLALAAALCPVLAEPCVWLAHLARDRESAGSWAAAARKRLLALGTAWDKRLTFDEWLALTEVESDASAVEVPSPRALFEATVRGAGAPRSNGAPPPEGRFLRYVQRFATPGRGRPGAIYPELDSRPWHDPLTFPIVTYLESHYEEIRAELLALDPSRFHREAEPIKRSGDWDVLFLYERGRRHDEVCGACPVTTRGIEGYPAVRTIAGLIYVSRMRGKTHIQPHRGPTNLRVRCHLGIQVPDGECAIRVGDETRHWQEGRCIVFDDHFEHEAWNRTRKDRIVLIVDLWHPGLSATEIGLIEALHRYTFAQARNLSGYWTANARAAGGRR
jgi:aspartate beta-hydroxylase